LAEVEKAKAVARLADAQIRLNAATLAAQDTPDVAQARQQVEAAAAEKTAALEAAAEAARKAAPVSVFISRKTQSSTARLSKSSTKSILRWCRRCVGRLAFVLRAHELVGHEVAVGGYSLLPDSAAHRVVDAFG
jgi:hypothetical protein